MDRRTFLTRFPVALAGGAASMLSARAGEHPEHRELHMLLVNATQHYEQARELIHRPHRYNEARPLLEQARDDAAQAWLRLRGVHKQKPHHDWAFTACNTRDANSGIAWNEARGACCMLSKHCDHMGRWGKEAGVDVATRCTTIERARKELIWALDNVSHCIECTRMVLDRRQAAFPPFPRPPVGIRRVV